MIGRGRWRIGLLLVLLATTVRGVWAATVPTIPVGDFATYRESANYLAEFGHLDRGFVYMPGLVLLLAAIRGLAGGDSVLADKLLGAAFGGLAAGPLYLLTSRLFDNGLRVEPGQRVQSLEPAPASGRAPVAFAAGLAYALWPAGIASASVIGTDIPTAALLALALALLCLWGETRPSLAAAGFGAAMGLAAYFRAVALPLTLLSAGYWLVLRAGLRATVTRMAIAVGVTVLMLLPWGLRNLRQSGELYLTDSHGGITLLMGNYPNTEGTYSRSLGVLFQELTGRTFLMEPHRQTDRAAYAIARQWVAFDPVWTAGMIALRTERLFAPERGLLYWSVYRPGVLPRGAAAWFNQHRRVITKAADLFYLVFVAGVAAGVAFTVAERRWRAMVVLAFALALAATYALFVAEPRYRLTTEVLLFPLAAFGVVRVGAVGGRAISVLLRNVARRVPALRVNAARWPWPKGTGRFALSAVERRALPGTAIVMAAVVLAIVAVVRGGSGLRDGRRWAATAVRVDGQPRMALWRPRVEGGGPSPIRGTPTGAVLTIAPGRREAIAEILLPQVRLPAGSVRVVATILWLGQPTPGTRLAIGSTDLTVPDPQASVANDASVASGATRATGFFAHSGGPVHFIARLERPGDTQRAASISIADVALTTPAVDEP